MLFLIKFHQNSTFPTIFQTCISPTGIKIPTTKAFKERQLNSNVIQAFIQEKQKVQKTLQKVIRDQKIANQKRT